MRELGGLTAEQSAEVQKWLKVSSEQFGDELLFLNYILIVMKYIDGIQKCFGSPYLLDSTQMYCMNLVLVQMRWISFRVDYQTNKRVIASY